MYNYLVQKYRKESKKMKKISLAKIASLIFVCVMLFAALAIGVYADETTESIVPKDVFTFKGYSIDEDGNACFGFTLNPSAKEEYEYQLGTTVDIGLVIAIYEDGNTPLDAEGNPTGKAYKKSLNDIQSTSYSYKLVNFESLGSTKYVITPYVSNGTNVYYYENGEVSETVGGISYDEIVLATHEHTEVIDAAVAATCTETGLTEGKHCETCGEVLVAQEVIPALGHNYVDGYCSACESVDPDYYFPMTIPEALNAELGTNVIVSGTVCEIYQPWSDQYGNISVYITDDEGNKFLCFQMSPNVVKGDIITVTGEIGEFNGVKQLAKGGTAVINGHDDSYDVGPAEMTIAEALAAADGTDVIVTGTVIRIDGAWNSSYGNMNVTIKDEKGDELYIYRLSTQVALHDIITITGAMATYNGARQIGAGATADKIGTHTCSDFTEATCEKLAACVFCGTTTGELAAHNYVDGVCSVCGKEEGAAEVVEYELTLSFADTANRTEFSTSKQVWVQNGVIFTNNKASSTSNVANYYNPVRLYKSSEIVITVEGKLITKIVFECGSDSYATALANSISGATATVSSKTVTVELDSAVESFTISSMSAQVRVNSLTVTAVDACKHESTTTTTTKEATCTEAGCATVTCNNCSEIVSETEIAALGHTYENGACIRCGLAEAHVHNFVGTVTLPTCTEKGYTTYTCECGEDTYVDNYVDALGHTDENSDYICDIEECGEYALPEDGEALTIAQVLAIGALTTTTQKYYVTGIITEVYNTTYGNMYIKDESTETVLTVYGLYTADGSIRYDAMDVKPVAGDEITVYAVIGAYNGTPQLVNAWLDEHIAHTHEYTVAATCTKGASCAICGAVEEGSEPIDHTVVDVPAVDATCTATGLTAGTKCSVCETVITEQEVVAALGHTTDNGVCERCNETIGGEAGGETGGETILPGNLSFTSAANKANADSYMNTNFPEWTITGKLGQTYGGYLGFGRNGDATSSIKSSAISTSSAFTVTAVIKGNGSSGVMTSTLTFTLVDASGNVVATGYANGSTTAAITPADAKDTTYDISFTFVEGKTWSDVSNLVVSFNKAAGNIGLKSLDFVQ